MLASQAVEQEIRDLAGARLIFYTNTDVNRFLESRLIPENFEVHWDTTRVHHPTEENAQQRYQAIHYTVLLNAQCVALPEYSVFKGMRCEIQIQTILNHAWAETSHDILYKPPTGTGFGTKAIQSIENRMMRIMDEYLLPAGYELQKVQHDFERLMQGKALFDRGMIEALEKCGNNNDRHEVLSTIQEYVLPNYDDVGAVYPELKRALLKAFDDAQKSPTIPIETPFGKLPGKTAHDIPTMIVDILSNLRYVDVEGAFRALLHIYSNEQDSRQREHVSRTIKGLADYNLHVWKQVGPAAQLILTESIDRLTPAERLELRDVLLPVWQEVLSSELRGTSFGADTVTFRSGALSVGDEMRQIRQSAINGIIDIFDRAPTEQGKTAAINSLWEATRLPTQASYSKELCALVLADTQRIAELLTARISGQPYQLLAHIERHLLFEYVRARDMAEAQQDTFGCKDLARSLMNVVGAFRDAVNADTRFVRYKTLVGYASVFEPQWDGDALDYRAREDYRKAKIAEFVQAITPENEKEWFDLIELCAATKSNDLATFPLFADFIVVLANEKPDVAARLLERASADLLNFLPAFLGGLLEGGTRDTYERTISYHLARGTHLAAMARHWRLARPEQPPFIDDVLTKAIAAADDVAVMECVALTVASHGTPSQPALEAFFGRAMRYLADREAYKWVREAWYLPEAEAFFAGLSTELAHMVLSSLLSSPRIDHDTEEILAGIAETHADLIWEFFGDRLSRKGEQDREPSYDAIPYQFHGLEKPLSRNADLAVNAIRSWYHPDDRLFEFGGAHLLSAVFPSFSQPLARRLSQMVTDGSDDDVDFVTTVLRRYRGEPATHGVLKQVIRRLPDDDPRLEKVEICLENTGVVSGQFGFVEAFRAKKAEIVAWQGDYNAKVKAFAERFIAKLDRRIAFEQRSAEERSELRKRDYDTGDDAEP